MAQIRINKVLRELNISLDRAVDFLESKGIEIEKSPNTKISQEVYDTLADEFQTDATKREKAQEVSEAKLKEKEELREQREREIEEKQSKEAVKESVVKAKADLSGPKTVGKIDLDKPKKAAPKVVEEPKEIADKKETKEEKSKKPKKAEAKKKPKKVEEKKEEETAEPAEETLKTKYQKLSGPTSTGEKIDLTKFEKPKKKKEDKPKKDTSTNKRKRRRISKAGVIRANPIMTIDSKEVEEALGLKVSRKSLAKKMYKNKFVKR
jgi:translation initiation factor IF-2